MEVIRFIEGLEKRKLVSGAISFCFGIIIAESIGILKEIFIFALLLVFFIAITYVYRKNYQRVVITHILKLLVFPLFLGFFLFTYQQETIENKYKNIVGLHVNIDGIIATSPQSKPGKMGIVVDTKKITIPMSEQKKNPKTKIMNGKVLLWVMVDDEINRYSPGSRITFTGELTLPQGIRNPMGFDYQKYLAAKKISAIFYLKESDLRGSKENTSINIDKIKYLAPKIGFGIRESIVTTIKSLLPESHAALLNGMLIGYTDDLDEETEQQFRDAGLSHIMAVSGSNVAFIVLPLFFLLRRFGMSERSVAGLIIPILVLFIFVTGFSASVARAVMMAIIILIGKFIYREADTLTTIAASVLLLLVTNPFMLFDIGFQLSYGATLGIIFFYKTLNTYFSKIHVPKFINEVLSATLAAQIGVLPISAYYFNRISMISVVSNLLVVPMTQFITIIGFVMVFLRPVFFYGAKIIGTSNLLMLSSILKITKISANMPFAAIDIPTPTILEVLSFYVLAAFFLWYKPKSKISFGLKKEAIVCALIISILMILRMIPGGFQIYFLDVGQGDSCFIKTSSGKVIFVDGGGFTSKSTMDKTMGDAVIIPFLLDKGIMKIDMLIATHGHDDHIQGFITILKKMKVKKLLIPDNENKESEFKTLLDLARKKGVEVFSLHRGDIVKIDEKTKLQVLYPTEEYKPINTTLNNGSLVLKLIHDGQSTLLCGDIEAEVEEYLVNSKTNLSCDILKVAHHGSSTSSSLEFIKATEAKIGIVSVGRNNFGHPSYLVLSRLKNIGAEALRTDECGALQAEFSKGKISIVRTVEK